MAEAEVFQIRSGSPSQSVDSDVESVDFLCPDYDNDEDDENEVTEEHSREKDHTLSKAPLTSLVPSEMISPSALKNLFDKNSGQDIHKQCQEREMIVGQIREEVIDKQNDGKKKTKDDAIEEEEMILNVADLSKTNQRDAKISRDEEEGTLREAVKKRQEEERKKIELMHKQAEPGKETEISRLDEVEVEMQPKRKREMEEVDRRELKVKKSKKKEQTPEKKEEIKESLINTVQATPERRGQVANEVKTTTKRQENMSGHQAEEKRLAELGSSYEKDIDVKEDKLRQIETEKHIEAELQKTIRSNEKDVHIHDIENKNNLVVVVGVASASSSATVDSKRKSTRSSRLSGEEIQNLRNVLSSSSSSTPLGPSINEESQTDCNSNNKCRKKDDNEAFNVLLTAATSMASPNTMINIDQKPTRKSKRRDESNQNNEIKNNIADSIKLVKEDNNEMNTNFIDDRSENDSIPVEIVIKKTKITRGGMTDFFPLVVAKASASDEIISASRNNKDDNRNHNNIDDADDRLNLIDKICETAHTSVSSDNPISKIKMPVKVISKPLKGIKSKKNVTKSIEEGNNSEEYSGNDISIALASEKSAVEEVEKVTEQNLNDKKISRGGVAGGKLENCDGEDKAEERKVPKRTEKKEIEKKVAVGKAKEKKEEVEKVEDEKHKDAKIKKEDEVKGNEIQIMNTGLTYKEGQFEQFALDIGGVVAEGPQTATHLITLDFIKRTPKVIRIKS